MSCLNDLGLSEHDLNRASQPLREKILASYAKIKGLELLQTGQSIARDSRRLDARARAAYRNLGVDVSNDPPDENVLGNKTINNFGAVPALLISVALMAAAGLLAYAMARPDTTSTTVIQPATPATPTPSDDGYAVESSITPGFGTPQKYTP